MNSNSKAKGIYSEYELTCLNHLIVFEIIIPDNPKIKAIFNLPQTEYKDDLQRFSDMTNCAIFFRD